MRRVCSWFVSWAVVLAMGSGLGAAAAEVALPQPVSVGPVEVKAVRWLAEGYNPVWASDGSCFVVSHWDAGFFRYRPDGSGETRLGKNSEAFCDLSPDGKSVLYCPTRKITVGKKLDRQQIRVANGVWLMKADGSGRRVVNKKTGFAKWSPDGRYFLCQTERVPTMWGEPAWQDGPVFIYDRSGKLVRQLEYTNGPASWSGDGQYLAYVGKAGKIYLARGDGSSPKVVDEPAGEERNAQLWWSPKGHNLLYAWREERGGRWTSPLCHFAPGSTPIELCDTFWTVVWSPTGNRAATCAVGGLITAFAFPETGDAKVLFSRALGTGDSYVRYTWAGDGQSLFYYAAGLWLATGDEEEDRRIGRSKKISPVAALPGARIMVCWGVNDDGDFTDTSNLWLLDPTTDEVTQLLPRPEQQCNVEGFARNGRTMLVGVHLKTGAWKLLLCQIARRT